VNRTQLQNLANVRLEDAKVLLERERWAGAYYLSGYVVECALKACLLRHLGDSGAIFGEQSYLKRLSECWTHDLVKLVGLAGLDAEFGASRQSNSALDGFWGVTKDWNERSRYEETAEADAKALFEAVSHNPDGVFLWIRSRW
jgi:HEPN domain-containing protein